MTSRRSAAAASVAMGNASTEVKRVGTSVTLLNCEDVGDCAVGWGMKCQLECEVEPERKRRFRCGAGPVKNKQLP